MILRFFLGITLLATSLYAKDTIPAGQIPAAGPALNYELIVAVTRDLDKATSASMAAGALKRYHVAAKQSARFAASSSANSTPGASKLIISRSSDAAEKASRDFVKAIQKAVERYGADPEFQNAILLFAEPAKAK